MFKSGTVIVLGAAVSNEVGLPLGNDLKTAIADVLPHQNGGDDNVRTALFQGAQMKANVMAAHAIRNSIRRAASIDNLIEHRGFDPAFKHCAKVGILAAILQGEAKSKLTRPPPNPIGTILAQDTTYADLFRIMVGSAAVSDLPEALSRVRFINFNYDRCLEHFLYDWLIGYSGLGTSEAGKLVDALVVVRPYGSIGPLSDGDRPGVPFGEKLGRLDLNALASNILTFSEEREAGVETAVRGLMREAQQLIFLGCAYHEQNIRLLTPDYCPYHEVYGTCYVVPPDDAHSHPSMESFAAPIASAFERAIGQWPAPNGFQGARQVRFEPLTSRQLVAKYAPGWISA